MKLVVSDKKKISNIQEEFNQIFPYLKIEFFSTPHKEGEGSSKKLLKQNTKTLGECRTIHKSGSITVTADMKVSELEQKFSDLFGLSVQVFRKSGKVWLETTVTDSWTLEEQNLQGEALSNPSKLD